MPRVEVIVRGSARDNVDGNILQRAIAEVVKNITGGSCQVIVNMRKTSGISERVAQYSIQPSIYNGR